MAQVGLGQAATVTGRIRSKKLKDAIRDNHPVYMAMEDHGGIRTEDGGRTIIEGAKSVQANTSWVGPSGSLSLSNPKLIDGAEYDWSYLLSAAVWTLAEQYQNSGGSDTKLADLIGAKYEIAEDSAMNTFHGGMISNGAGTNGLQMLGLAGLVSTTPSTGTVGTIDRSDADAAWFRNQYTTSSTAVGSATTDASNILRFLDNGIDGAVKDGKVQQQIGLLGSTHFGYATQALRSFQKIESSKEGRGGFDRIFHRGVPLYLSGGVNYSGASAQTATRTYLLNVKRGGVNLVFHEKARFDLLEPVHSADNLGVSRLLFTMAAMTIGALAGLCWAGADG